MISVTAVRELKMMYNYTKKSPEELFGGSLLLNLCASVLLPLETTLLSNVSGNITVMGVVLLPLEITLLSNCDVQMTAAPGVLLPLEITLLSNMT